MGRLLVRLRRLTTAARPAPSDPKSAPRSQRHERRAAGRPRATGRVRRWSGYRTVTVIALELVAPAALANSAT